MMGIAGILGCGPSTSAADSRNVIDFAKPDQAAGWRVVNDGVMGGLSQSQFVVNEGVAAFSGNVSLDNNGGFASLRSPSRAWFGEAAQALLIRVKGDGKKYKLTLRQDDGFSSPNYQAGFSTRAGEWQEIRLALADFQPTFRGRRLGGIGPIDLTKVRTVGLLISDKQEGAFRLEIASIRPVP